MKKCPQCSRTYPDDTLAFCLEDGALLSLSFNEPQTAAPTFKLNAVDMQTAEAPETPTVVNSARPAEPTSGAGWTVYLAGLFISLIVDLIYIYVFYPFYLEAMQGIFNAIAHKFDDISLGYTVAGTVIGAPLNLIVYSSLAFALAFVWRRGKWKWGIIALIPNWGFMLYYMTINLLGEYFSPFYYIRIIILNIIYLVFTCLLASIGSWISGRIFNKQV